MKITAKIKNIIFQGDDGYQVLSVRLSNGFYICVVNGGSMPPLKPLKTVDWVLEVEPTTHPRYGNQYRLVSAEKVKKVKHAPNADQTDAPSSIRKLKQAESLNRKHFRSMATSHGR